MHKISGVAPRYPKNLKKTCAAVRYCETSQLYEISRLKVVILQWINLENKLLEFLDFCVCQKTWFKQQAQRVFSTYSFFRIARSSLNTQKQNLKSETFSVFCIFSSQTNSWSLVMRILRRSHRVMLKQKIQNFFYRLFVEIQPPSFHRI